MLPCGLKTQNGLYKAEAGETYIKLVQFTKDGPIIESISVCM